MHPADELPGYQIPMHLSLTQMVLMGGVPRRFAILNATAALCVGMGLQLWWLGLPAGLLTHLAAMWLTRRDPHWFEILHGYIRQPEYFAS